MGLQSALSTALTGMNAAETSIDVVGNNVANANTIGFKESKVNFATQFLETQSIGSSPNASFGGTNPRQIGLGVKVAEISPEFTQGTIEISSNPLDLAIQGEGFFIVQGSSGEQFYTRNGQFKTNSNNEIVTITGHRVLGYGVDDNFEIQPTGLVPLQIPLGTAAVAQATENVFLEGSLDPQSDVGTVPAIIQSTVLSDGSKEVPTDTAILQSLAVPTESTTAALGGGAGSIGVGTYSYRVSFLDGDGNEGPSSNVTSAVAVGAPGSSIDLNNVPQPAGGSEFTNIRIYRNNSDVDTIFREVTTVAVGTTSLTDTADDAAIAANTQLDLNGLDSGSYSYYVTFYNSVSGEETRPTARFGPVTADQTTSPRIRLDSIPTPSADPLTGGFDGVRIYRNLENNQNQFHQVGEISPAQVAAFGVDDISFIDNSPDTLITSQPELNLEGPAISFGLPLVDVVSRDGSNYVNLFQEGDLTFTGTQGGRDLAPRTLTITSTTTVQDLISFMEESMGIVKTATEPTFPGSTNFGGDIVDSKIQFTSNMGEENALDINLSAFQLSVGGAPSFSLSLPFGNINETTSAEFYGEGASADFVVYDSLGIPLSVRVTTVLEEKDGNSATFRWIATSPDNEPETGYSTVVGTGVINTDGEGNVSSLSNDVIAVERRTSPSASPLEFRLNLDQVSGLSKGTPENPFNELSASQQDGFPAGSLSSFIVTDSGRIQGVFSNGSSRDLGQVRMARFANTSGLEQLGDNLFAPGVNSGLPIQGDPGSQGIGSVTAGAVELSNSDIGAELD